MKHVIAFDISMGKSYMVIYNAQKQCVFESEIKHSKPEFKKLQEKIHELTDKTVNCLKSYSKQQVSIPGS